MAFPALVALALTASVADVRGSTYFQLARRALLPGAAGVVVETETVAAVYGYAFARITGVDLPWAKNALSAELSAWGALGALPSPSGRQADGDLQAAWVQHEGRNIRLRLGRQVTLPGAARYVRFDGASAAVGLGSLELSGYFGGVTLPRFGAPRGYHVLGTWSEALKNPALLERASGPGDWTGGGVLAWSGWPHARASVGFHEQRGVQGTLFRALCADAQVTPRGFPAALGGRFVFDLQTVSPAEARAWLDVAAISALPLALEYAYAAPALLLPQTSVLAAFGSEAWHELGLDASFAPSQVVRLSARAAGQAYAGGSLGARLSARAVWTPDLDGRWSLRAEYAKVWAPENGYHHLRAAARYVAWAQLAATVDLGAHLYDRPVRGARASVMATTSFEVPLGRRFKAMASASLASTPFAALDVQGLARLVFELDGPSAGGGG